MKRINYGSPARWNTLLFISIIFALVTLPVISVMWHRFLLSHGAVVQMPVIFMNTGRAYISTGLVCLFTCVVIFSAGYKLVLFRLENQSLNLN